jgi:hypothetical protein
MSVSGGPDIIESNLVACFDAANIKSYPGSGTVWTDLSRRNNNASLVNGPTFSNENSGAIIFDGTNDYALISSFLNTFNGPFSLSFTFYQTSNTLSAALFSNYNAASNDGLFMQINSASEGSGFRITYRQLGTNIFNFTQTAAVSLNTFYNIICTYNGANAYTYYNGVRQSVSAAASTYFTPVNNDLFLGALTTTERLFAGKIYEIKIYNNALSDIQVLQNYNATKGRYRLIF